MHNYCNLLNFSNINDKVKLYGWVQNIRILKKIIFINLRDITGLMQIVFKRENKKLLNNLLLLTQESCVKIKGIVKKKKNTINNIEIIAYYIKIFNYSHQLPINILLENKEKIKFKYRYLYLRKHNMLNVLKIRSDLKLFINNFFNKKKFIEIETPFLSKSFLEGANSYIVKSRLYKNKFYSLPQSPQIFKQLLMISGINKYYQIVKCFRDENLRSDRQPEFTQIDIELSFYSFNYLSNLIENLIFKIWLKYNKKIIKPFKKITYYNCINKYGTDKPDLRNPIKYNINLSNFLFKNVFINENINNIKVLLIKNIINLLNFNLINKFIIDNKINNYLYIYINSFINNKYKYNICGDLNLNKNIINNILFKNNISANNFIFLILLKNNKKINLLVKIRNFFCNLFNLFNENIFFPIWIINFPMFFFDKFNNINSFHHPFTMPLNTSLEKLKDIKDYTKLLANSYDLVINGYELGSGSQRIHKFEIQREIFNILNIKDKYDFFIEALKYGTPPHLGIALGLDRILMLLLNLNSIKDVIAFPKTNSGLCLLTGAPD